MTCDICGRVGGDLIEVKEEYATPELARICRACEKDVNAQLLKLRCATSRIFLGWAKRFIAERMEGRRRRREEPAAACSFCGDGTSFRCLVTFSDSVTCPKCGVTYLRAAPDPTEPRMAPGDSAAGAPAARPKMLAPPSIAIGSDGFVSVTGGQFEGAGCRDVVRLGVAWAIEKLGAALAESLSAEKPKLTGRG